MRSCPSETTLALLAGDDLPAATAAVREHVAGCGRCAEAVAGFEAVRGLSLRLGVEAGPAMPDLPDLAEQVTAALARMAPVASFPAQVPARAPWRSRAGAWLRTAAMAAGMAAAAMLAAAAFWPAGEPGGLDTAGVKVAAVAADQIEAAALPATDAGRLVVRRLGDGALAFDVVGGGGEAAREPRLLASASPRDWTAAAPLPASDRFQDDGAALPAWRDGGRALTFFRVQ